MYVEISEFASVGLHRFRVDWADAGRPIFQTHAQATTIAGAARMSFGVERHRSRVPPAPSPRSALSRRVGKVGLPASAQPTRAQELVSKSFELHDWIAERLDGLQLPGGLRSSLSISCHDLVIEHHLGIVVLARAKIYGSAFALVRSLFETFVRGVWLRHCATDSEIQNYQSDKLNLTFGHLVSAVETVPGFGDGVLSGLKGNSWSAMSSYTHGGALQSGRRFSGESVEPNYDAEEVSEVIRLSGTFALMAFQQIALETGRLDLVNEAIERLPPVKP